MRISTKCRFAVNALIDLALHEPAGPVALASICRRQQVSLSFLEQVFSRLRRHELVTSVRGPGGGYRLGRSAEKISVADIVSAVDDRQPVPGEGERGADLADELWRRLDAALLQHMAGISLAALVREQRVKGVHVEPRPRRVAIAALPAPMPPPTRAPNSVFAFGRSFARA